MRYEVRGKETVVVALATPQPVAGSVEGHARHQGHVYRFIVSESLTNGFQNVEGTFRKVGQ